MSVDFDDLQSALLAAQADTGAAECHGSLCGALCAPAGSEDGWQRGWLEQVLGEAARNRSEAVQNASRAMLALFAATQKTLDEEDLEFQPLLPGDDAELGARAIALSQWCDGFVFGVGLATGLAHTSNAANTSGASAKVEGNTDEVVKDFMEIARVAAASVEDEGGDEEEGAYFELVEYVRVAAMLLFAERAPKAVKAQNAPSPTTLQ